MASLVPVLRSCMESFKSILTSQEFGTEYELLCTELSLQWLRVRLWGESIGLLFDEAGRLQESLFNRPNIESTVTQCVNSVAFLLTEIEVIRRKYEFRPPLELISDNNQNAEKSNHVCQSLGRFSSVTAAASLRQRMKDNQKQKSFLAITKWAICDAKRFNEKVKRLKGLIDGLEDVSRAAGITRPSLAHSRSLTIRSSENPPPYSLDPPSSQRTREAVTSAVTTGSRTSTARQERELPRHYDNLKRYVGPSSAVEESRRARTQEKLLRLTNTQLYELRVDIFDELCRREQEGVAPPFLPSDASYHPKRNLARQKISTLPPHRFRDLTMDLVFELERRFPFLWLKAIPEVEPVSNLPDPFSIPRDSITRRFGCVLPPNAPPPLLQDRAVHRKTIAHVHVTSSAEFRPRLSSRFSQSSTTLSGVSGPTGSITQLGTKASWPAQVAPVTEDSSSRPTAEIFKSFRVSMEDSTYKVLPAALKKYNINVSWEQYALYIVYGDKERCLGMEEKPLVLFKQLDKQGKKPMFMLRKLGLALAETSNEVKSHYVPPGGLLPVVCLSVVDLENQELEVRCGENLVGGTFPFS